MATLEKSCRRKAKKGKKTKSSMPSCDTEGEHHETLLSTSREDPDIDLNVSAQKESSQVTEVCPLVEASIIEDSIHHTRSPANECGGVVGSVCSLASTSQEHLLFEKSQNTLPRDGKGNESSASVKEIDVGGLPNRVVIPDGVKIRKNPTPLVTCLPNPPSSICTANSVPENEPQSKISALKVPSEISKANKGAESGEGSFILKSGKSDVYILKATTSEGVRLKTFNDEKAGIGHNTELRVNVAAYSQLVQTLPSAPPCDISVEEDNLGRIRCLEESSLRNLYPLSAFHVASPSESVIRNHPLYTLLCDYLLACSHLDRSLKKHKALATKVEELQESVWSITEKEVVESARCSDGVMLSSGYCKSVAVKDKTKLSELASTLSSARETLHSECCLHFFDSETQQLRVEHFIQLEEDAQAEIPSPEELRVCVAILFSFVQRHGLNSTFFTKVQSWLLRLGKVLLKIAAPSDHLLLLSQLLRCPKGVSEWGTPLVQFRPPPPLQSGNHSVTKQCLELELVMAALPILIEAVDAVEYSPRTDSHQIKELDDVWVILDSYGEEECNNLPGDEDLASFLDQFPLKAVVSHALGLSNVDHSPSLTGVDILRLFSLSNYSLTILGSGLNKNGSRRYPCFFRKISILVNHLTYLFTDLWDFFKSSKHYHRDPAMQARLEVEFEALFIRAFGYLFQGIIHSIGWEMLSQLPFQYLSVHVLWHLLAVLHKCGKRTCDGNVNIPPGGTKGWIAEIKESCSFFDSTILAEPLEDTSLLLTTMKNMAIASEDATFAEAVSFDIFRVGHMIPETRGTELSKIANEFLGSIFSKHPCLFPVLIGWLKEAPQEVEKAALELFSSLPTHLWQPSMADLKLIFSWILSHDPQTIKSTIARNILLALPWRGCGNVGPMPLDVTISTAAVALDACLIWDSKGRIPSSMRFESVTSAWAWSLVSCLCIHPIDRNHCQARSQDAFNDYDILHVVLSRGLLEGHPLASLLSVLATQQGHTWDEAKEHAFTHLSNVVAHGKHSAAIFALYHILPLFFDQCDDLVNCPSFQKLLLALLYADRTYVKMAKSLIIHEFPGPTLLQLGHMIVSLLEKPYRFGTTTSVFVIMWLRSILQVPNWKNEKEALYLLDLIFRSAFFEPSGRAWDEALAIFGQVTKNMLHVQASSGTLSSIINLLARGPAPGTPRPFSHMSQSSYPNLPWFVLAALEVEEVHESFLWDQLQIEYRTAAFSLGNFSLDTTIKNACQTLGVLPFPAAYLCIYRWARQALGTPFGNPALLLIWARFFSLYSKLFSCSGQSCTMLFEGSSFSALLVQMKKKLNECVEWYNREASSDDDHQASLWLRHCSRLFHAFGLWLEGGKHLYQSVHSPQYSPSRLPMVILYEDRRSWQMEFVDIVQCKNEIAAAVKSWDEVRKDYRETMNTLNYAQSSHYLPPLHRIRSRLGSCRDPFPLPFPLHLETIQRLEYPQIVCGKEATSKAIINCLTPLLECARLSSLHFSEHTALDCAFIELFPNLYKDVWIEFSRSVPCMSSALREDASSSCSSPARINFKVKESKMCQEVWADLERNVGCRKRITATVLKTVPIEACSSGVLLENMARDLVSEKKNHDVLQIQETALCALNHLLRVLSEEAVMYCLPVKKLVTSCIETLVHEFVLGNEKQFTKLFSQMLENSVLSEILSPLLTPVDLPTSGLLQAYGILTKRLPNIDYNLAFVLLSKFEVRNWLSQQISLKQERISLVKLLINGIACCHSDSSDRDWTLVIGLFQKHLRLVLMYKFPEILVEVLELILIATGDHHLPPLIWYDLMECIVSMGCLNKSTTTSTSVQKSDGSPDEWSLLVKEFSMTQNILSLIKVKEVVMLFATFFRRERLQFGLHGIYPKYRTHIKPIEKFLELLGCSLLAMSLRERKEIITSPASPDSTWLSLREMYSPWLLPYWEDELMGSECTVWIMELMIGHPPLTPWIIPDSTFAKDVASSFVKCLQFMIEIAPGHRNSLGLIWEMYCSAFARMGVGSHVLSIIHSSLVLLPWDHFWPSVKNLKDMVEVAESSSPECRCFLRAILSKVHWKEWTDSLSSSVPLSAQALSNFLKVLLLISGNVCSCEVSDTSLLPTLLAAQAISWQNLGTTEYSALLDLFTSRVNPKVALSWNSLGNDGDEEIALLKLLKLAGGLAEITYSKDFHQKSLSFLYAIVQLLLLIIENDQQNVTPTQNSSEKLQELLCEIERFVKTGLSAEENSQVEEMADVMKQVLIPVLPKASPKFIQVLSLAVASKSGSQKSSPPATLCAKGILLALESTSHSPIQLGLLIESAIETSLFNKINSYSTMESIRRILLNGGENMTVFGTALSSAGYILTLMSYLHSTCSDDVSLEKNNYEDCLHQLVHRWLPSIVVTDDTEAKIPLLWSHSLILGHKVMEINPKENSASLEDLSVLAASLLVLGDGKEGMVSSLLGAVGLKRRPSSSKRFRVLCLAFSTFLFACLNKEGVHELQLKEALAGLDNLCCRYKEFGEVSVITSTVTNNLVCYSFLDGSELLAKLFCRLYPEKPGYLQCMK
ncbi:ectopic P granules protein 5 homolog isoform X2 [Hetaerina americana]|uniref:ectopic P granules protein 5 homolog isoform X2 n=1 Tax=Hetaerina americana TaxID=62018 RepID=UPI003A7F4530